MTLQNFITRVNYRLRGTDDDAPTAATDEYTYWVDTLNMKKDELYQDVAKQWSNTYQVLALGTIAASTEPTFDLDDTFLSAANKAYVIDTNNQRHPLDIIKAQEDVDDSKQQVFVAGQDPQTLYFTKAIIAGDSLIGGTLYLPAYVMPDDVSATSATAFIPIPDPNWAVLAVAAELAGNDLTYEDRAPDLNAKANNLYKLMTKKSSRGTYGNPRKTPYNMTRIGERRSRR